jgi:hypothetical protein
MAERLVPECPVCGDPVRLAGSHVMRARVGQEPLFFHDACSRVDAKLVDKLIRSDERG